MSDNVITFDNLVRPTDVVGKLTEVTAVQPPQAFVNTNAAGSTRQFESLDEVRGCGAKSAESLLKLLKS